MRIAIICATLLVSGCSTISGFFPKSKTSVSGQGFSISHDAEVKSAPEVHINTSTEKIPVPSGSRVILTEFSAIPATSATALIPARKETVIELPKNAGTEISSMVVKTDAYGSGGFTPPPPATPFQKSIAIWTYLGAGLVVLGVFFCTPYGGSNPRCGAIVAGGGVLMAVSAAFLDQFKLPAWFPSVFLISLILALAVYWGYRVRHSQITAPQAV